MYLGSGKRKFRFGRRKPSLPALYARYPPVPAVRPTVATGPFATSGARLARLFGDIVCWSSLSIPRIWEETTTRQRSFRFPVGEVKSACFRRHPS